MNSVKENALRIVRLEGGYVNDPDDLGGATNFGVTIGTMRRLGLDKTGDGKITTADVMALTETDAVKIFIDHYFKAPGIVNLPKVLQDSVFDMYVNSGSNAVKILQKLLPEFGFVVDVDGAIGPQTVTASKSAQRDAPKHIRDAYGIARRNYYYGLADARPKSRKYAKRRDGGKGGWITRAESYISKKYHLTEEQHKKRTEQWV